MGGPLHGAALDLSKVVSRQASGLKERSGAKASAGRFRLAPDQCDKVGDVGFVLEAPYALEYFLDLSAGQDGASVGLELVRGVIEGARVAGSALPACRGHDVARAGLIDDNFRDRAGLRRRRLAQLDGIRQPGDELVLERCFVPDGGVGGVLAQGQSRGPGHAVLRSH